MRAGPTFLSFKQNSRRAGKVGWSITHSISSGGKGDIRKLPQIERKQLLLDLLGENDVELPVLYSEHLVGDGQTMFEHAAKLNWEGIISKRADAPYRSERNENWLKIKTVHKGKFPVVGFVKDPSGVAALYLGKQEGKDLVYMGKVGTGWSRTVSSQIRKQLDTVVSPEVEANQSDQEAKGDMGGAEVLRRY
jgi:bifunctional non-homologous end joining protein LigD